MLDTWAVPKNELSDIGQKQIDNLLQYVINREEASKRRQLEKEKQNEQASGV